MCPKLIFVSLFVIAVYGTQVIKSNRPTNFDLISGKWCARMDIVRKLDIPQTCGTVALYETSNEYYSYWAATSTLKSSRPGKPLERIQFFCRILNILRGHTQTPFTQGDYHKKLEVTALQFDKDLGQLSAVKTGQNIRVWIIRNRKIDENPFLNSDIFNQKITPTQLQPNDIIITFTSSFEKVPKPIIINIVSNILPPLRLESASSSESEKYPELSFEIIEKDDVDDDEDDDDSFEIIEMDDVDGYEADSKDNFPDSTLDWIEPPSYNPKSFPTKFHSPSKFQVVRSTDEQKAINDSSNIAQALAEALGETALQYLEKDENVLIIVHIVGH